MSRKVISKTFSLVNGIVQGGSTDEEVEYEKNPSPPPSQPVVNPRIRCSHILIKHRDSLRPISWRTNSRVTRLQEDALRLIESFRDQIRAGMSYTDSWLVLQGTFENLASKYSECSSAKSGGDLGFFSSGQMQWSFEKAAFSLPVGGLSEPVWTDSGCHLIIRTA